jgi:hypothetical protein
MPPPGAGVERGGVFPKHFSLGFGLGLPPAPPRSSRPLESSRRGMKFRDLSFIGIVLLVAGGLQTLSFVNKPPAMPTDIHHTTVSRDVRAQCLRCHRAKTLLSLERASRHPAKWRDARSDCLLCHIPAGGAKREAEPGTARTPCATFERQGNSWRIAMTK